MKNKIKKFFKALFQISILIIFVSAIFLETNNLLIFFVNKKLGKIFLGNTEIKKVKITPFNIHIYDLRVDDITKDYPFSFIYVKEMVIPIPYYKLFDNSYPINKITIKGAKIYIRYLKQRKKWNVFENLVKRKKKSTKKHSPFFRDIEVKNSLVFFEFPINKVPMIFKLKKAKAYIRLQNNYILKFIVSGMEKNIGKYSVSGYRNYRTKDLLAINNIPEIDLKNKFSQHFFRTLLSFLKYYEFNGKMELNIKISEKSGKWSPIKYTLGLKASNFIDKENTLNITNLNGNIEIIKNKMKINNVSTYFHIKKLTRPLENLQAEAVWDKKKIEFRNIKSSIFAGTMEGILDIFFKDKFTSEIHMKGCDFSKIAKFYKLSDKNVEGIFFLDTKIKSEKKDNWDVFADGNCYIRKGKFFKFPLFLQIFDFLNFQFPGKEKEKKVDINWELKHHNIIVKDIEISNGSVDFYGSGTIKNYEYLDFVLTTQLSKSGLLDIPLIGDVTHDISKEILKKLVTIKILGTIDKPIIKKQSVERLPEKTIKYFLNILKAVSSPLINTNENNKKKDNKSKK